MTNIMNISMNTNMMNYDYDNYDNDIGMSNSE